MTKSLLEQIHKQEDRVRKAKDNLAKEQAALSKLTDLRVNCSHTFTKPVLNYEHEGGYCTICGINEIYAHYLKSSKK